MLLGAYQAMREHDLKAILAKTTGSTLGMLMLLYGVGATSQDALQILNHALYKGALFLVAGIVEHHAHTRDLRRLGGLRGALPLPFVAAVLAGASMAGVVPPLLGFVAKESFFEALLHAPALQANPLARWAILGASLSTSAFLIVTALRFVGGVFLGTAPAEAARHPARIGSLWVAPLVLAAAALALGLATPSGVTAALAAAASSRPGAHVALALVPAAGPTLAALVLLALGIAAYAWRARIVATVERVAVLPPAERVWRLTLDGVVRVAEAYSTRWENGSLRWYLAATVLTLPLLVAYAFWRLGLSYRDVGVGAGELSLLGSLFCALVVATATTAVRARTRLAAAIASSATGFLVAMLYVVYRSPDILLTQILIETVGTMFILLLLVHLPQFPRHDLGGAARLVNGGIAAAVGLSVTVLLLLAMTPGIRETDNVATRPGGLLSLSLAEGGGANAVNVIIVDIRALDTSGEITVLVVVGLCVYGLLRARRRTA
jgi:NADH:ubiquinone oxidoreductase subunit 5 (subunit L)/multisubunit Na+/H+ antiporter MnhA subunit